MTEPLDAECHIIRMYSSADEAAAVTAEHSPTVWRASNAGWADI